MTNEQLEAELTSLAPSPADPSEAVAAAYEAGRRDAEQAAKPAVYRLRIAAGVLLAATLGLGGAMVASDSGGSRGPWSARPPIVEPVPVPEQPAEQAPRLPPRHPQSYAAVRAAVFTADGDVDLDQLPASVGGASRPVLRAGSIF